MACYELRLIQGAQSSFTEVKPPLLQGYLNNNKKLNKNNEGIIVSPHEFFREAP